MEFLTIESMLNDITGLVVVVIVFVILILLFCITLYLYHVEERKKILDKIEKLNQNYFECSLHNTMLITKVDLLERYIDLESSDDDDE